MCVLEDIYKRHISHAPETHARECLAMGLELLDGGEYARSLPYFEEAGKQLQTAPEAFEGKLRALLGMEDYTSMRRAIDYQLKVFPEDTTAYEYLSQLYMVDDKYDGALECYDRIIEIRPYDENPYIAKSELLFTMGEYEQSSAVVEEVLERYPDSERANFQMGKNCMVQGQYIEAIEFFDRVVSVNPYNETAASCKEFSLEGYVVKEKNEFKKALALLDNGMYTEALHHFELMMEERGESAELYYYLGRVYRGMGNDTRMIECMQKSFRMAPYSVQPYVEIGEYLIERGREKDAIEYFERVLDIDPHHRTAHIRIGEFMQSVGLPAQAEEHYNMVIKDNNSDAEAYLLKGIAAIDRYPAAGNPMLYFDRAMELDPTYALPMYYRAKFQLLSGQKKRLALESFNKAAYLAAQSDDEHLLSKCRTAIAEIVAARNGDD